VIPPSAVWLRAGCMSCTYVVGITIIISTPYLITSTHPGQSL
jgi:uncharacterized membrane protein YqaE (UPF0057 family)